MLEEVSQILDDTATNVDTADKVSINIKYKYTSACVLNIIGTNWVNFSDSNRLSFYSPWSDREIWPFLKVAISPTPKRPRPPKLVSMHVISIPTCINFLSRFRLIKFFDHHGL